MEKRVGIEGKGERREKMDEGEKGEGEVQNKSKNTPSFNSCLRPVCNSCTRSALPTSKFYRQLY